MIPPPRTNVSPPLPRRENVFDIDEDDDGWQDMPVVRSEDIPAGFDEDDPRKRKYQAPLRLDSQHQQEHGPTGNATGAALELDPEITTTDNWREKNLEEDESDYTRLRPFEDEESEEVNMRTNYLFNEDKAMTPLSQMQATKELLTEGQRIAYVGLAALVAREMIMDMRRGLTPPKNKSKESESGVVESGKLWLLKIMARLYQHMDLSADEQKMIDLLAEHGVIAADLVPALMTTHTVKNPEYDPEAARRQAEEDERARKREEEEESFRRSAELAREWEEEQERLSEDESVHSRVVDVTEGPSPPVSVMSLPSPEKEKKKGKEQKKAVNPFGDSESDDELPISPIKSPKHRKRPPLLSVTSSTSNFGSRGKSDFADMEEGDIAGSLAGDDDPKTATPVATPSTAKPGSAGKTPTSAGAPPATPRAKPTTAAEVVKLGRREDGPKVSEALPGVSTTLSKTDENVTLDIRWTVLCDLFLQLIGDSVYDSRSRVFLERVAAKLGLTWLDVTRFEKRVTDSLEIQEGVEQKEHQEIIEGRAKSSKKRRIAMMGLATLGGGLVLGLSAGLLAPVIGAGLGAALAGVGVSGTTAFLSGAGGTALIATTGVVTGGRIGAKGMFRRTKNVRTFEFRTVHNNKRVNCLITVPGYMASINDDVRLPFSTLDSIIGDVFSVHWEPEMMNELGNALKILTAEVLSSVGQSLVGATVMMGGLMSGIAIPVVLTKLGYLIDNPWSNALDRAYQAGLVLADVLIQRHAGVRPITLAGYSLGARVIFYALDELAKQKAFGIVQDVYLFGATVTAPRATWMNARAAVAGRFVNAYATNDWVLGYLYRATSGGLNTVAGLTEVQNIPGLENIDVTDKIAGHLSYRPCMPALLEFVGLPITADWFDEPDDPEFDMAGQDRIVVDPAMEGSEQRLQKKFLGIFPRSKKKSGSGRSTPTPQPPPAYTQSATTPASANYEADNDDGDIAGASHDAAPVITPVTLKNGTSASTLRAQPASPNSASSSTTDLPRTAGFDLKAISDAIANNTDTSTQVLPIDKAINPSTSVNTGISSRSPIERTDSAPPLESEPNPSINIEPTPATPAESSRPDPRRTASEAFNRDDIGTDPVTLATPLPTFDNEWSRGLTPGSNAEAAIMAAPPPRPFPSHILASAANIFADKSSDAPDDDDIGGDIGGFSSRAPSNNIWNSTPNNDRNVKDDWAMKNPW